MKQGDAVWCSNSGGYAIHIEAEWMGVVPWDNDSGNMHIVKRKGVPMCFEFARPAVDSIDQYIDRRHFHLSGGSIFDVDGNAVLVQEVDVLKYVDPMWLENGKIYDCGRVLDADELVANYLMLLEEGDAF